MARPMNTYTGIYKTTSELKARRVLTNVTFKGTRLWFILQDGWFEIIFPAVILTPEDAHRLNRLAHTLEHTDLPALPLQNFTQGDSQS